jgi:hypothetical protein
MSIIDCLNTQFRLYHRLKKLNRDILQYLDNNNLNINYYCIHEDKCGDITHILTSDTIKNGKRGHYKISITMEEIIENKVSIFDNITTVHYENIIITVLPSSINLLKVQVCDKIINNKIDLNLCYDKDIDESLFINMHATNYTDKTSKMLKMFINLNTLTLTDKINDEIKIFENNLPNNLHKLVINVNRLFIRKLPKYLHTINFENVVTFPNINFLNHLDTAILNNYCTSPIPTNYFPQSLKTLMFDNHFDQMIYQNSLPPMLETITFGYHFNHQILTDILPISLKNLTFGYSYNLPIGKNVLPPLLENLVYGYMYNQVVEIDVLPMSLKSLIFGYSYNQVIMKGVLPQLSKISFGPKYNQVIVELPESIKVIKFEYFGTLVKKDRLLPRPFVYLATYRAY